MTLRSSRRFILLLLSTLIAAVIAVSPGAPAHAGGWAIGSLDEMPEAVAGESVDVGFRILQHGLTPVDLPEDVGIEIIRAGGTVEFFPAASGEATGHYVAAVTFPDTIGSYSWHIRMGWFGRHDLGTVDVTAPDTSSTGTLWSSVRWVMLAVAVTLGAIALADLVVGRRYRRHALA